MHELESYKPNLCFKKPQVQSASNLGVGSFDFEFKSARVMNMIKSSNFILVEHINTIKEIVQTNIL